METDVLKIIDRILNGIDNIDPTLTDDKRFELALMLVIEVRSVIPMYIGELNPKWKLWEDTRIELNKKCYYENKRRNR